MTVARYRNRIRTRWFRTLNYVSIAFTTLIVTASFLVADYLLVALIQWLLRDELRESRFAARVLSSVKIGIALITMVLLVVHSLRAARAQYLLDAKLAAEEE